MELEWFKFHTIWSEGVRDLSDAEAGRFLKAVCDYIDTKEVKALSGNEKLLFSIALKQMKQDEAYSARISSVRAEARRGKGSKQKEMISNDINSYQTISNENKKNNSCNKSKELRIKNKEEELINIAETDISATQKAKTEALTPEDHDFWKFAKENAELAETFYKATGIHPVKSQFGRWVNDCKDLAEAGISAERLQKTISYMQSEGIQISAPGSCLKTAQWLKSRGSVPVKSPKLPTTAKYNAFEELAMRMNGIPVPDYDVEVKQ